LGNKVFVVNGENDPEYRKYTKIGRNLIINQNDIKLISLLLVIIKMFYQSALNYFTNTLQHLNNKLVYPSQLLQNSLFLKTETIPEIIRTPINFIMSFLFVSFAIIYYTNNFLCNLVGTVYPITHGFNMLKTQPFNTEKLVTLNKYWIVFNLMTLIESFNFIINLIPWYYYCKLVLIYLLIRNDFTLVNTTFGLLMKYYNSLNSRSTLESYNYLVPDKAAIN
jgi:hypothetical protein